MKLNDLIKIIDNYTFINIFIYGMCIYSGYVENYNVKQLLYVDSICCNDNVMTIGVNTYDKETRKTN